MEPTAKSTICTSLVISNPSEKETPAFESEIEEADEGVIFKVIRELAPDSKKHYKLKLYNEIQFSLTASTKNPVIWLKHDITRDLKAKIDSEGMGLAKQLMYDPTTSD